jgi:hypothetical protein
MDTSRLANWKVHAPPWLFESLRTSLPKRRILRRGCKIHGIYALPKGYDLTYVPSDAKVLKDPSGRKDLSVEISSSYNVAKTAIAVGQTLYAAITLYEARGNQIDLYGYASFGLTVTPYVIMSVLNLIGQFLTPDFPTLFLVHNREMDEARGRGGYFDGVVGRLSPPSSETFSEWIVERPPPERRGRAPANNNQPTFDNVLNPPSVVLRRVSSISRPSRDPSQASGRSGQSEASRVVDKFHIKGTPLLGQTWDMKSSLSIPSCTPFEREVRSASKKLFQEKSFEDKPRRHSRSFLLFWAPLVFGSVSLLIIGLLSRFRQGSSTKAQRGWTMTWLVLGMLLGGLSDFWSTFLIPTKDRLKKRDMCEFIWRLVAFSLLFGVLLAPAIGGFVVVGQMLVDYGSCTRIG